MFYMRKLFSASPSKTRSPGNQNSTRRERGREEENQNQNKNKNKEQRAGIEDRTSFSETVEIWEESWGNVVKPASGNSSRSTSPSSTVSGIPHSFIPTPNSRTSLNEKQQQQQQQQQINSVKNSGSKSSSVRLQNNNSVNSVHVNSNSNSNSSSTGNNVVNAKNNSSMLEKFKFFKDKDKGDKIKSSTESKRTSSSSGFSSARSERSDSSISLSSETKKGLLEGSKSTSTSTTAPSTGKGGSGSIIQQSPAVTPNSNSNSNPNSSLQNGTNSTVNSTSTSTPRLAIKGFRQKLGKAIASKDSSISSKGNHHSPKTSRKDAGVLDSSQIQTSSTSKGSQHQQHQLSSKIQSSKPDLGHPTSTNSSSNGQSRDRDRDKVSERQVKIETKLRAPRSSVMDGIHSSSSTSLSHTDITHTNTNTNTISNSNTSSGQSQSFLRQPKPTSANSTSNIAVSRDSRQRFSGTGIPTRNSLIVNGNSYSNSSSKEHLHQPHVQTQNHVQSQSDLVTNTNNLNSSMSSIVGNGTGIPKPTAAVKGTTKFSQNPNPSVLKDPTKNHNHIEKEEKTDSTCNFSNHNQNTNTNSNANLTKDCVINKSPIKQSKLVNSSNTASLSLPMTTTTTTSTSTENGKGDDSANSVKSTQMPANVNVNNKNEMANLNGVSVAMVSPMPGSINTNANANVNVLSSISSIDSSLSQSNSNSNSNSNSSEASVILKGKLTSHYDKNHCAENNTNANANVNGNVNGHVNNSVNSVEENVSDYSPPEPPNHQDDRNSDKSFLNASSSVSSMSVCKSDSSTSPSANDDTLALNLHSSSPSNSNSKSNVNGHHDNDNDNDNNSSCKNDENENDDNALGEFEEDELLVNVTPMEPLLRGYIKSPGGGGGGGNGFLSPKSPNANQMPPQMVRMALTETGMNSARVLNSMASRHVYNPYSDSVRIVVRKHVVPPNNNKHGSHNGGHYIHSHGDYAAVENLDISAAGYLSDGDLLSSGTRRTNDGYLSESGTSAYSHRRLHQTSSTSSDRHGHGHNRSSKMTSSSAQGPSNTTKQIQQQQQQQQHAFITEDRSSVLGNGNGPDLLNVDVKVVGDKTGGRVVAKGRFDDSSSLSSSDLNEIPTDLTSSSINSELSSPYGSLQRGGSVNNYKSKKEQQQQQPVESHNIIYRVVGSRSGNSSSRKHHQNHHHLQQQQQVEQHSSFPSNGEVQLGLTKTVHLTKASSSSPSSSVNGYYPTSTSSSVGIESHHHLSSGKLLVTRDKHGNLTGSLHHTNSQNHQLASSNGIQCGATAPQTLIFHQQHQQLSNSNTKTTRADGKTMNNLGDSSKKKGMIGIKDDYYGKEMADREGKERHRSNSNISVGSGTGSASGHHSSHGHKSGGGSGGSSVGSSASTSDGKRSNSIKGGPSSGGGASFSYIRRSTGSGSGSGSNIITKYSISPNGKVHSSSSSGGGGGRHEKELLTAEEYKAAQVSLLSRLDSSGLMGNGSPKTRTKVKISGGTQTTNDLHEMSRNSHSHHSQPQLQSQSQHHHQSSYHHHQQNQHQNPGQAQQLQHQQQQHQQHQQQQQQHHYQQQQMMGDVQYATSNCSRNSGSFSSQSSQPGYKSLSLTTPTATQLSQSLRERILGSQSLPKAATSSADYAAILATIQQQQQQHQHQQIYGTPNASKDRMSRYNKCMNDGSMSDTGGYSNYSEIQAFSNSNNPYMRYSTGYASSITSAPTRLIGAGGSVTEAESLESLSSNSSMAAHLRDGRSNSLTQAQSRMSSHHNETSPSRSPRLNRSNSISHFRERTFPRSTKSEKLYPSMLQRSDDANHQYYSAQLAAGVNNVGIPTSPMHNAQNRLVGGQGPYSSTPASNHSVRLSMSPYSEFLSKIATKEDEINASSLSLVSTASSIYSSQEDKQAYEIRKLKRELNEAQDKVNSLTNQLTTNADVVAAFEQSLSNMTQRLQSLSATAEQKDSELAELRATIELLRKQSIEAGLTVTGLTSGSRDGSPIGRQLSADSVSSINSISSACSGTSHSHTSGPSGQILMTPLGTPTHHGSVNTCMPESPNTKKKHAKNRGWLRSSFTKAFSRSKSNKSKIDSFIDGDFEDGTFRRPSNLNGHGNGNYGETLHLNGHCHKRHLTGDSVPASPLLTSPHGLNGHHHNKNGGGSSTGSHSPRSNDHGKVGSSSALSDDLDESKSLDELKKLVREKERALTDIQLEALTSAHQLESFKETVNKMRSEMLSLKQDNERLQRMVSSKSLANSQTFLPLNSIDSLDRRLSSEVPSPPNSIDIMLADGSEKEGKRVIVSVLLGSHGYSDSNSSNEGLPAAECNVGSFVVSSKTKWEVLDSSIRRVFKDYVMRLDPVTNLGLNADSIISYNVGEVIRSKDSLQPELLPCGYFVGDVNKIRLCLKGAVNNGALDALSFETLIPKSILQRYVSLLSDHGRIILCGPSGTGKSYLARKLGEYIVARSGKDPCPEAIATFSADQKNSKELRQYLANLAEQCETSVKADLPSVIILDNLHQVSSFGEVFNGFLHSSKNENNPIIIGTMSQSTSSAANLQLHHNFRWIMYGNHIEPVKGFLSRYLLRRLIEAEIQNGVRNVELTRVMEWIPKVWLHVNKFLEAHNSSDVTIGPRLYLSCPTDVANSQVWFTDLWHYSIVPYLIEAVKEGLHTYGKQQQQWEDPAQFLLQTYPWTESHSLMTTGKASLLSLRPEDVGYDMKTIPNGIGSKTNNNKSETNDTDPLMNMLMRLQEAANYNSGQTSNDSDTSSSHISLESTKDFTTTA